MLNGPALRLRAVPAEVNEPTMRVGEIGDVADGNRCSNHSRGRRSYMAWPLRACNPSLASATLDVEPNIGVLLPCKVVIREVHGRVQVDALDPELLVSMTSPGELAPIAALAALNA